jgi:hypothetical protein
MAARKTKPENLLVFGANNMATPPIMVNVFNLLSSGLYRRLRSHTGSCAGHLEKRLPRSTLLVGFTTGGELRFK